MPKPLRMICGDACRRLRRSIKRLSNTADHSERGFALVMVLWGVALLGLLAALFGGQSRSSLLVARQLGTTVEFSQIAGSALTYVIEDLLRPGLSRQWLANGTPVNLTIDGKSVTVRLFDEDGKISLNRADKSILRQIIAAVGSDKDPDTIAAAIVDWRMPKPNAASAQLAGGGNAVPDSAARPREFVSIDELRVLPAIDDSLFQALCPYVTANSLLASPDRRLMSSALKSAIGGWTADTEPSGADVSLSGDTATIGLNRGNGLTRSEPASQFKVYSIDVAFRSDEGVARHFAAMFTFNQNSIGSLVDFLRPLQESSGSACVSQLTTQAN